MKTLASARKLCVEIMAKRGLIACGWQFNLVDLLGPKGCYAVCFQSKRLISLDKSTAIEFSRKEIIEIINHEIAHAVSTPGAGHSTQWEMNCERLGSRPNRYFYRHETFENGEENGTK
jgi:hypothetical protein